MVMAILKPMTALAAALCVSACSFVVDTDECAADEDCRLDQDADLRCVGGECVVSEGAAVDSSGASAHRAEPEDVR